MARLKEKRRVNLRKERTRNHKIILNALIMVNQSIMPGIITRNRNKMEKLK
jgi:transcription initiation factor IIE alpha subunit